MRKALLLVTAAALLGCGATVSLSRVGPTLPAKPDTCDFTVLRAAPSEPYQELGTIDIQYPSQTAWINEEPDFKKKIRPLVCQAGGDAAIAHTNNYGLYLKATVLSSAPPAPSAPAQKPAAQDPSAAVDEATENDKLL